MNTLNAVGAGKFPPKDNTVTPTKKVVASTTDTVTPTKDTVTPTKKIFASTTDTVTPTNKPAPPAKKPVKKPAPEYSSASESETKKRVTKRGQKGKRKRIQTDHYNPGENEGGGRQSKKDKKASFLKQALHGGPWTFEEITRLIDAI